MGMSAADTFWDDCDLIQRDPQVLSGAPVLKGTRLAADALVLNVESFVELEGFSEDEAINATLEAFPNTPGGKETLRSLMAYESARLPQMQP